MILNSIFTQIGLVLVALISGLGGAYAVWASRGERNAKTGKTDAEAERLSDQTWIDRLKALDANFEKLQRLSDERFERLVAIEMLITEHVSWDFQVVRAMRENGLVVDDPPSLTFIKHLTEQAKEREALSQDVIRKNGISDDAEAE